MGPVRLNNGIGVLLCARAAVRYAPGAVRLGAEEGLLAPGFLNPGISTAPRDELQLGSPAQSRCAEGREMLSAEPKKVRARRKALESGSWAGKREGSVSLLLCFLRSNLNELLLLLKGKKKSSH